MQDSFHLALELRSSDPEAALALYARLAETIDASDVEVFEWIAEHSRPVVLKDLRPLFERVARSSAAFPHRRLALNKLAATAYYEGRTQEAEALWRGAVHDGRAARDRAWGSAVNNLGLVLHERGRFFEALVLFGMAQREAGENVHVEAYARCMRARAILGLGDLELATHELAVARAFHEAHRDELSTIGDSLPATEEKLLMAKGEWARAMEHSNRRLERLEVGHHADSLVVSARTQRLCIRFELEPQARGEILGELEELARATPLDGTWGTQESAEVQLLRWRLAVGQGQTEVATTAAQGFLDLEPNLCSYEQLKQAVTLLDQLELPVPLRDAMLDRATTACLHRILEAQQDARFLPELGKVTAEDREILRGYQERLAEDRGPLLERVAMRWHRGEPAYDRMIGAGTAAGSAPLTLCAWCLRVRGKEGEWAFVVDLPALSSNLSHGICEACVQADEVGA